MEIKTTNKNKGIIQKEFISLQIKINMGFFLLINKYIYISIHKFSSIERVIKHLITYNWEQYNLAYTLWSRILRLIVVKSIITESVKYKIRHNTHIYRYGPMYIYIY